MTVDTTSARGVGLNSTPNKSPATITTEEEENEDAIERMSKERGWSCQMTRLITRHEHRRVVRRAERPEHPVHHFM